MQNDYYKGFNWKDKSYLIYLRKFSNHPGRRKLRRFITNFFFPKGIGVISAYNAKFRIKTFDYIDQKIIFGKNYEPETLSLCYSLISARDVFIDIGSNFGLYAINIGTKPETQVVAIEPNPAIFNRLQDNMNLNQLDNVLLFNIAVGEKTICQVWCVRQLIIPAITRSLARPVNFI
jgi:hypothetical protein